MKIVAVIPARGGSKGIYRKNLKHLNGKPLISYIIETAKKVPMINRVIVSTEDNEIKEIALKYGAEVPFMRPVELSHDDVPTLPVLQHAVRYLEEQEKYHPDIIVLLYPTNPLVQPVHVSECINRMIDGYEFARHDFTPMVDSVVSVVKDVGHYWMDMKNAIRLYPAVVKNRQEHEPLYKENGAVYVMTWELLMESNMIVGGNIDFYLMGKDEAVDIDLLSDFEYAEFLMNKRRLCK